MGVFRTLNEQIQQLYHMYTLRRENKYLWDMNYGIEFQKQTQISTYKFI